MTVTVVCFFASPLTGEWCGLRYTKRMLIFLEWFCVVTSLFICRSIFNDSLSSSVLKKIHINCVASSRLESSRNNRVYTLLLVSKA